MQNVGFNANALSNAPLKDVAVVGARGYSGLELTRILLGHPGIGHVTCFASESIFDISAYLPEATAPANAKRLTVLPIKEWPTVAKTTKTFFLATPAEVSFELAPALLNEGVNVVDLSGAFRLTPEAAQKWYKLPAEAMTALSQAQYGLVPWAGPAKGASHATLISNPGCYATSVLMALLPLLNDGLIDIDTLTIDAKSGATGAGRKANEDLLYCEVDAECRPYKVGAHQHLPEICEKASVFAGALIDPIFVTHLLPVRRGIISGIYARAPKNKSVTAAELQKAFEKAYSHYPLVTFGAINPKKPHELSLKRITGSARTQISFEVKDNKIFVFSLIDNLLKGAASQAIENFNRINDLPLTTGLTELKGLL